MSSQPKLFPTAPTVYCGPVRFQEHRQAHKAAMSMLWLARALKVVIPPFSIRRCPKCNGWHVLVAL